MRLSICLVTASIVYLPQWACAQSAPSGPSSGSARVRVDLPPGWKAKTPPSKNMVQHAEFPDLNANFSLSVQPKSDLADKVDLMAWAKMMEEGRAKLSTLGNRKVTELRERTLKGRPTVEYEISGEIKNRKFRFRSNMLQFGDYYCEILCGTIPSHWDDAQPKFEELVDQLK
jgi:hypothetical protein